MRSAEVPPELRLWRLCKTFGGVPSQWDGEPARTLDWLLAIDDVAAEVEHDRAEKAARG